LGHKRTFAVQNVMSALTPKADIERHLLDVRFVPIADIGSPIRSPRGPAQAVSAVGQFQSPLRS